MTQINPARMSGTVSLEVFAEENGQYVCEISQSLSVGEENRSDSSRFYGQRGGFTNQSVEPLAYLDKPAPDVQLPMLPDII
jgi:hypothetical protein